MLKQAKSFTYLARARRAETGTFIAVRIFGANDMSQDVAACRKRRFSPQPLFLQREFARCRMSQMSQSSPKRSDRHQPAVARCSMTAAWIISALTSYRSKKSRRFAACSMQHRKHYSPSRRRPLPAAPSYTNKNASHFTGRRFAFTHSSPPPALTPARWRASLYATPFALKCASSFAHPSFAASALYVGR